MVPIELRDGTCGAISVAVSADAAKEAFCWTSRYRFRRAVERAGSGSGFGQPIPAIGAFSS
jgi:hypothetical protein